MYKGKKILALIPARGGSKGLPGKNKRPMLGKPLVAWTIEQARRSKYLDKVIVSTDDTAIADIARQYGAEVPFIRPEKYARDTTPAMDVVFHAISFMEKKGQEYDMLFLLEPTSPLREPEDIDNAIRILVNHGKAKAIVSVAPHESTHHEFTILEDLKTGLIRKLKGKKFRSLRRQELKKTYYFDGTVYLSDMKTLIKKKTFYHDMTMPYIVPRWKALEIDELSDAICAEALLKARKEGIL